MGVPAASTRWLVACLRMPSSVARKGSAEAVSPLTSTSSMSRAMASAIISMMRLAQLTALDAVLERLVGEAHLGLEQLGVELDGGEVRA